MFVDADLFVSQCNEEGLVINSDRAEVKDRVRGHDLLLQLARCCMPDLKLQTKKQTQVYKYCFRLLEHKSFPVTIKIYWPATSHSYCQLFLWWQNAAEHSQVNDTMPSCSVFSLPTSSMKAEFQGWEILLMTLLQMLLGCLRCPLQSFWNTEFNG